MTKTELPDADVEQGGGATPQQMSTILNLARSQKGLELELEKMIQAVKEKQIALKKVAEVDVPNALRDAGLEEMPLGEGWTVKMKTILAGSITEANRDKAHEWLEAHSFGGLIKHWITIKFNRDDDKFFKKFMSDLAKRKRPVDAERKDAVNTQTLGAFVREQVGLAQEAGKDPKDVIPFDLLGVYQLQYAEIVPPRKSRAASL